MIDSENVLEFLEENGYPLVIFNDDSGNIEVYKKESVDSIFSIPSGFIVLSEANGWDLQDIDVFINICMEEGYNQLSDNTVTTSDFLRDDIDD